MPGKLDSVIDKLPEVLRPLARLYAGVLERTEPETIAGWIINGFSDDWRDTHERLVAAMTTNEIVADHAARNVALAKLNNDFAQLQKGQRAILDTLLKELVTIALAAL